MSGMLDVSRLSKVYTRGRFERTPTFRLDADFRIEEPAIVGMMGPNGSGKTTLFELITGSNSPTAGEVRVCGRDIHTIRTDERDRLAIHYHQSYQVRHFWSLRPNVLMERAGSDYPQVHLFDEPQFNTQDGYIGFMLDFFRRLRGQGRLVFLCVHPNERFHLEILEEICERFVFVNKGVTTLLPDYAALLGFEPARAYLGTLLTDRDATLEGAA
jgi:ABC-type multidrug transport system ATPase subunit